MKMETWRIGRRMHLDRIRQADAQAGVKAGDGQGDAADDDAEPYTEEDRDELGLVEGVGGISQF